MENYEPIDSRYLHPRDPGNGILPAERTLKIFQWFLDQGWNPIAAASILETDYDTIRGRIEVQIGEGINKLTEFLNVYRPNRAFSEMKEEYYSVHHTILSYKAQKGIP